MRILIAALLALPLLAAAAPFPHGDPAAGKKLYVAADCSKCHSERVGGDGSRMYTRPERKVKSASQLLAQVRMCNTRLNTGWFPEDEENVAAYLNRKYYKFK
ncbi:MAG: c-type cytochrome [Burkholderiales bacterium]